MAVVSDTGEYKDSICIAALRKIMDNDNESNLQITKSLIKPVKVAE